MEPNQLISRRASFEHLTRSALGLLAARIPLQSSKSLERIKPVEKKFVPVMITPFDLNQKIDYNRLPALIDFYQRAGAKGFFANCLSSEMYFLNDQERLELTRFVVKHVGNKANVVSTGSFGDTLNDKVDFAKKIYDTGANGVILISSHFAQANESNAVLMKNFETFLSQTGNIKLGTYECPNPYKRLLAPDVFQSLVADKRMIYHKDTSEDIDNIEEKLKIAQGTQLELYNAHTASAAASLQKGASGMSPISGNFYPEIHSWLCRYASDPSKADDVNWIQGEITRTEPLISKFYPLSSKYFLKKRGVPIELVSRSKSGPIPAEQIQVLDTVYNNFLQWCDRLDIKPASGLG